MSWHADLQKLHQVTFHNWDRKQHNTAQHTQRPFSKQIFLPSDTDTTRGNHLQTDWWVTTPGYNTTAIQLLQYNCYNTTSAMGTKGHVRISYAKADSYVCSWLMYNGDAGADPCTMDFSLNTCPYKETWTNTDLELDKYRSATQTKAIIQIMLSNPDITHHHQMCTCALWLGGQAGACLTEAS
jgi:hypothetical protein